LGLRRVRVWICPPSTGPASVLIRFEDLSFEATPASFRADPDSIDVEVGLPIRRVVWHQNPRTGITGSYR